MVKSSNKIISLALALILVVNVFAGVTLSSKAATPWIWEPYSTGYAVSQNLASVDNVVSGYTTFTVTGDDPGVCPGGTLWSLASTPSLGKLDADSLKYGVVRYRTTTATNGTIYANADKTIEVTSFAAYNGTGEWTDYKFDSNLTGSVNWYRYDVFEGNTGSIDVAFVAYFDTDANRAAYLANRAMPGEYTTEQISVDGTYLRSINTDSPKTWNLDNSDGYVPFGTSWTAAGFAEGSSFIRLGYDNFVYLGDYDFSNVEKVIITYHTGGDLVAENSKRPGTKYSVGLAKAAASFGWDNQEPNFSQAIAYGAISNGTSNGWPVARTVTITDIDNTYSGGVWLTNYGCNEQMLVVVGITLVKVETPFDPKYDVTVGTVENGTVIATPNGEVEEGTTVTVTATPATDYVLDKIYVNGTAISGNTFDVTENAVVTATFKKVQYAVSVGTVTNGTVTVAPNGTVNKGTEVTVTATPATGYQLDKILVNGTAISGNKFTVAGASVVTATFKKIQYAVSVGTVSNGTVTLSATGNVDYGTTVTITATPADGYTLDQILVNGTAISGNTFDVTENAVVTATFKELPPSIVTYEVSVGTVTNGTVTATPLGTVEEGRTITVTATPAAGYQLDAILVNGTAITGTTFELTGDAVITATFSLIPIVKYDVSVGTVTNGTVTATPSGEVEEGTTITVTATPATGYQLDAILVNGTAITGTTFELTGDAVITATFSLIPVTKYDVTVGTVENGTVIATPNGEVEEGTTVTVTATPAEGYALDNILVNGTAITGTTFEVTADSVVTATFKKTTVSVGNILIDKMNFNIWTEPYNTIIFDDTYAGPYRGPWQYTLVCRYNSVLGKYVVEEKYIPKANSNTSFSLAPNQIIINAVESSESYKACSSVWAATNVGSVLTLSGIDLVNQTVSEGAYAAVENGVTIPEDPNKGTEYPGNKISAYYMNFDFIEADDEKIVASDVGGLGGEGYKYTGGTFNVADKLVLTGWNATANGIDRYEYSLDRMNFTKIEDASIAARDDLTAANVAYPTGHSTAGCVITIPASVFGTDGTYNLTVRAVDKQGNYYDIFSSVINADVPEGTVNPDQGGQTPGGNGGQEDNVGTDDSMAFTVVGLMAMVAMVAVVLKRRKEY